MVDVPLALVDGSAQMLEYSSRWAGPGVQLLLGASDGLPLPNDSVHLLTASLGDPFNTPQFWSEASRVLVRDGRALFTTPAFSWAHAFRANSSIEASEFELGDGSIVDLPSFIYAESDQVALIEAAGFRVDVIQHVARSELQGMISPKLLVGTGDLPVVSAYSV